MEQVYSPPTWNDLQRRIVRLVAQGFDDREIAAEVLLSEGTVERLVTVIMHDLGLCDRLDLVLYGIMRGLAVTAPALREKHGQGSSSVAA